MNSDNLSILVAFGSLIVSAVSMFIAFLALRYTKVARLEDLRDKHRLVFLQSRHFWEWPGNRDDQERLQLQIANRSPNLVTIKAVDWSIENPLTTWELKQVAHITNITLPARLQQSDEIVFDVCPRSMFHIVWLNRDISLGEKIYYFKNIRFRVLLTTGQEHFVRIPKPFTESLVLRHVRNRFLAALVSFYILR